VKISTDKYAEKARMQFGSGVSANSVLATDALPALILFRNGLCYPMRSYEEGIAWRKGEDAKDGFSWFRRTSRPLKKPDYQRGW